MENGFSSQKTNLLFSKVFHSSTLLDLCISVPLLVILRFNCFNFISRCKEFPFVIRLRVIVTTPLRETPCRESFVFEKAPSPGLSRHQKGGLVIACLILTITNCMAIAVSNLDWHALMAKTKKAANISSCKSKGSRNSYYTQCVSTCLFGEQANQFRIHNLNLEYQLKWTQNSKFCIELTVFMLTSKSLKISQGSTRCSSRDSQQNRM